MISCWGSTNMPVVRTNCCSGAHTWTHGLAFVLSKLFSQRGLWMTRRASFSKHFLEEHICTHWLARVLFMCFPSGFSLRIGPSSEDVRGTYLLGTLDNYCIHTWFIWRHLRRTTSSFSASTPQPGYLGKLLAKRIASVRVFSCHC